ncbi:MAG TPA: hypothetical protein VGM76_13540, partial [Lacipirellulaceae bacterium]
MGKPHFHWSQTVTIDERLSAHRIQLTRGFAKAIGEKARKSPILAQIVMDFVATLRGITIAASLPYWMVKQLTSFAEGYDEGAGEPLG